jgi:hypothetical protein
LVDKHDGVDWTFVTSQDSLAIDHCIVLHVWKYSHNLTVVTSKRQAIDAAFGKVQSVNSNSRFGVNEARIAPNADGSGCKRKHVEMNTNFFSLREFTSALDTEGSKVVCRHKKKDSRIDIC